MTTKPIALVQEVDGSYRANPVALDFLRQIRRPIAVVVIGGRYRSGKSFLLNKLLRLPARSGFQTGSTINACTKGIWLHPVLLEKDGQAALAMDTEGMGSMDATPEQDTKLLSIAVVLASIFIFNSTGALDEGSFADVAVLAHAASRLQEKDDGAWSAPELFWCLRDFTLQLVSPEGEALTPDQYLENCLAESDKGDSRALLKHFFAKRQLFPFVRPIMDESKLQKLNAIPEKDLRPEFCAQMEAFCANLSRHMQPKCVGGQMVDGSTLAHLCSAAVASINAGAVPSVKDTFTFLMENQLDESLKTAEVELEQLRDSMMRQLPLPPEKLTLEHDLIMPTCFENSPIFASKFQAAAQASRENMMEVLRNKNEQEGTRWMKEKITAASRLPSPNAFLTYLEEAPARLGCERALDSAPLVFETCFEGVRKQLVQAEETVRSMQAEKTQIDASTEQVRNENDELRMQLETALVNSATPQCGDFDSVGFENMRSELMAEIKEEASQAAAFSHQCERSTEALRTNESLIADLQERAKSEIFKEMQMELEITSSRSQSTERELRDECSQARARLFEEEETHQQRLTELRNDMIISVEEARNRFQKLSEEANTSAEASARDAAEWKDAEAEAARREAEQAIELSRSFSEMRTLEDRQADQIKDIKAYHIEMLAEKASMMRASHDENLAEMRRLREKTTEAEKANLRLHIENESHKRAGESHAEDIQQLQKVRRYAEELRTQLHDKELGMRTSTVLLDDCRKRLALSEGRLRETEENHSAKMRERDYRIAMLEVQMSAVVQK